MLRRLRSESGFLLVELLIALMLLNIGLLSIVAAFSAGSTALVHASRKATAGALADQQMELYRSLTYTAIALDQTSVNSTDSTYGSDAALNGSLGNDITTTTGCTGVPNQCNPSRSVTGPDHGSCSGARPRRRIFGCSVEPTTRTRASCSTGAVVPRRAELVPGRVSHRRHEATNSTRSLLSRLYAHLCRRLMRHVAPETCCKL